MAAQKNNTLELLKLFASYMVVFIHVPFRDEAGAVVDALARFAVPFFFLVSGYYSYQISCEKIKKRIKNIVSLLLLSVICCSLFEIVRSFALDTAGLAEFFQKYTDPRAYVKLLVLNEPMNFGHLWYLFAVLYVYIIFYFTTRFRIKETVLFLVSLFLLLTQIVLGEGLSVLGIALPISYMRNFALLGFPCFALGLFAKKHEQRLRNVPHYLIVILIVAGALESVISRLYFGEKDLFVGSLLVLVATVCIFIKRADAKAPACLNALDGCSTYIYIFHLMISDVLLIIYSITGINIYASLWLENLHPLAVCVASTLFAFLFIKILKKMRKT